MEFEQGHLYHIYNQGNNRGEIFFNEANYYYFLRKIRTHISPYTDIIAWCLMPNHFHLMVYVKHTHILVTSNIIQKKKQRTLNQSIAKMLSSYTRAINIQEDQTGSLFRSKTKAACLTEHKGLTPAYFNTFFGVAANVRLEEKEYPQRCFDYIHENPLTARLVAKAEEWEFSSLRDYLNLREGDLINKERAKGFVRF